MKIERKSSKITENERKEGDRREGASRETVRKGGQRKGGPESKGRIDQGVCCWQHQTSDNAGKEREETEDDSV